MAEGAAKALVADPVAPHRPSIVPIPMGCPLGEQRGAGYGVYNAAVGMTALPASLIAGLLWQGMGDSRPSFLARRWPWRPRA
jgi:hypothetical protein